MRGGLLLKALLSGHALHKNAVFAHNLLDGQLKFGLKLTS